MISDEPYRKIVFRGVSSTPPAAMIRNALVAYSHSKDLNLPGERIGYLAVSPRAADAGEVVEACVFCNRVLGFVNAPAFFQLAVEKFQGHPADVSVYQENRDTLLEVFARTGIQCVPPGGAFYLFPKSPTADEMAFVAAAKNEGILVVPGRGFGRSGHFRVAICVSTGDGPPLHPRVGTAGGPVPGRGKDMTVTFRRNIARMEGYAPGEQPQEPGFVKLNTNENPYPPSPKVRKAILSEADAPPAALPRPRRDRAAPAGGVDVRHSTCRGSSRETARTTCWR